MRNRTLAIIGIGVCLLILCGFFYEMGVHDGKDSGYETGYNRGRYDAVKP